MKAEWSPLLIVQTALGAMSIVTVNLALILLMFFEPPGQSKDMLNIIIGAVLGVGFANVYGFFFGQKEQSQQTDRAAAAAVEATKAADDNAKPIVVESPATVTVTPGEGETS